MHRRYKLAPFPALAAVMGLGYLLGDPGRTATGSFAFAKKIAPDIAGLTSMQVWGALFLVGAVTLAAALAANRATAVAIALQLGGGIYLWWSVVLAIAALTDPTASLNAWAIYAFAGWAHFYAGHRITTGRT